MAQFQIPDVVELNVGGRSFTTTLTTLTKDPDSMLATMFSGRHQVVKDKDGRCFIDCNGELFEYILDFLRFGSLPPSNKALQVYDQAHYFGVQTLLNKLDQFQKCRERNRIMKLKEKLNLTYYDNAKDQILQCVILTAFESLAFPVSALSDADIRSTLHTYKITNLQPTIKLENDLSKEMAECIEYDLSEMGYEVFIVNLTLVHLIQVKTDNRKLQPVTGCTTFKAGLYQDVTGWTKSNVGRYEGYLDKIANLVERI